MSSNVRPWIALALLAFVGTSAVQPAIAAAAPGDPAAAGAPAPAPAPPVAPVPPPAPAPVQGGAPPPAAPYYQPPPGTPYPPPYGYPPPPPGYAAYPPYGQTAPAQLVKVHRPRRGLVTAGAVTFGVTWGIAASISLILEDTCSSNCTTRNYFWIPVAGPLIVGLEEQEATSFFVLWSAAEAAGIAMFVVGVMGHDVMEYRIAKNGPTLRLAPLFARDTSGMMLTARW